MADNHPIVISPIHERVTVKWHGHAVASSDHALSLREASYPAVIYIPRADADMAFFERTSRETTCPYKGIANYFSLRNSDASDANAVWTYETPKDGVSAIKDHLAFYPDKVEFVRG